MSVAEPLPWQALAACRSNNQLTDLFFDEEERLSTIYECRKICATCPVFSECLSETTSPTGFKYLPWGITAGYPSSSRKIFSLGLEEPLDWRVDWDPDEYRIIGLVDVNRRAPCTTRHNPVDTGHGLACRKCGYPVKFIRRRR